MSINELYKSVLEGEPNSEEKLFSLLYERFGHFADHRIWDNEGAQEVVQEAMAVIGAEYKNIKIEISFAAWAYKVLDNKILTYIKNTQRKGKLVPVNDVADNLITLSSDPDLKLKLLECLKKINNHIHRHARILNLHYQGFSTSDICKKMKINRQNVYLILHRARIALEKCLKTGDIE
ncbi:MAG: RNA polymerase sigma factor [Candidatus Zixiibacteriota bacterium]